MRYTNVELQWHDMPERTFTALVGIGEWTEEEEDERVFFYFSNEAEFELAKRPEGIEDFRVLSEFSHV
jgi:hypothetical protein